MASKVFLEQSKAALHSALEVGAQGARKLAHAYLEITAASADWVGKSILILGPAGAAVGAYDVIAWHMNKPPIWSTYSKDSAPLLNYFYSRSAQIDSKQSIAVEALMALGVLVATPIAAMACFKIRDLAQKANQSF